LPAGLRHRCGLGPVAWGIDKRIAIDKPGFFLGMRTAGI
jgi:hypothetical protein